MGYQKDLERAMNLYGDQVLRLCYLYMKKQEEAEDIFQEVFLRYYSEKTKFESEEHEKAWIFRVTINLCKDTLKSFFRRNVVSLEALDGLFSVPKNELSFVREAVLQLPKKYRIPIYLHYFEGYSAVELSRMFGKSENTIYTWLSRGRMLLKKSLGGDFDE